MSDKEHRMEYNVGDLVKVRQAYDYNHVFDIGKRDTYTYGIVIGKTKRWWEAYELAQEKFTDGKTRYWDNVNYAPYHVLLVGQSRDREWVSPEYMELIS
jgi:hypothetical protein